MSNKYKLTNLNNTLTVFDLFICSSSYEDRSLSISKNIDSSKIKHIMVVYNTEYCEYADANRNILMEIFKGKVTSVSIKHADPIESADSMKDLIVDYIQKNNVKSVLLDITTFTHESLLILLRLFKTFCLDIRVTCIYANASEYNPQNKEDDKWLSKGIGEIRSVLGYSGNILPTRKTHLIMIVGYEFERATSIINALEPNALSLGFGRSDNATTDKNKEANEHYLQLVENMAASYTNISRFEVKCDDPFQTYEELQKLISNIKDMNTLIVPLNNKLSTLGVAFCAIKNDDIQLCYTPALSYNYEDYSVAGDSYYIFDVSTIFKKE